MTLLLFPGFLGDAGDFVPFTKELTTLLKPANADALKIISVDLPRLHPEWTKRKISALGPDIVTYCKELLSDKKLPGDSANKNAENGISYEKPWALGYSLGGRLLLEAARSQPEFFAGIIFISTNPGLVPADRPARLANDQTWSKKFLDLPWPELMQTWNSQAVFAGSSEPSRQDSVPRAQLAQILTNWSLANQTDSRLTPPPSYSRWIAGEKDQKVCIANQEVTTLWSQEFKMIPKASHRLHLEASKELASIVKLALYGN